MFDTHWNNRLFVLTLCAVNRIGDLHAANHTTKGRELAVEVRTIAHQNEEVSRGGIRLIAARHRNYAAHVPHVIWFIRNYPLHSRCQFGSPVFARRKIASLNYETFDYAAERWGVECALRREA